MHSLPATPRPNIAAHSPPLVVPAINADALAALTEAGTAPDDFKTISLGSDAVAEISDARDSVVDDRTTGDDIPDMEDFAEPNLVLAATAVDPVHRTALQSTPPH